SATIRSKKSRRFEARSGTLAQFRGLSAWRAVPRGKRKTGRYGDSRYLHWLDAVRVDACSTCAGLSWLSLFDHDARRRLQPAFPRSPAPRRQRTRDGADDGCHNRGCDPAASSKPSWPREISCQAAPARTLRGARLVGLGAADAIAPHPAHSAGRRRHAHPAAAAAGARPDQDSRHAADYSESAAWSGDVPGPRLALHVPVRALWRAGKSAQSVYGRVFAVTLWPLVPAQAGVQHLHSTLSGFPLTRAWAANAI